MMPQLFDNPSLMFAMIVVFTIMVIIALGAPDDTD